jgi:hypothetical protein
MKTWKLVGGLVVIAGIVGIFVGKMVPGLPSMGLPGFEKPTNHATPVVSVPIIDEPPVSEKAADDAERESPEPKPEELPEEAKDGKVLYVEVDSAGYRVSGSAEGLRPASLEEVVELAKKREGSAEGIKVRIKRLETSRYQAEVDLRDKLVDAGIERSAIVWLNGPPL